jgi:hypothetical protein
MTSILRRIEVALLSKRASSAVRQPAPDGSPPEPPLDQAPSGDSPISTIPVELQGFQARFNERAPDNFVTLMVQATGDGRFKLTGVGGPDHVKAYTDEIDAPDLRLGRLAREGKGGRRAIELLQLMREWSDINRRLGSWIDDIRTAVGDNELRLTIWDDTGYEVPWELFTLEGMFGSDASGGWLGALVAVTRRVSVRGAHQGQGRSEYRDELAEGEILVCIAPEMSDDSMALARFQHDAVEEEHLLNHLSERGTSLAVLYIACHGEFADSMTGMSLGKIYLPNLTDVSFPCLAAGSGLVFLNACHSGRMVPDPRLGRSLFGFAEAFLRQGAAVVIGATGDIGTHLASHVAVDVFDQIARHPEEPISVALTRARAKIADGVDVRGATDDQMRSLIYAFMFVAYGNPMTRVGLPVLLDEPGGSP